MTDRPDPALDRIDAVVRAISDLLTKERLICLDFADVMAALEPERDVATRSVFGQGEARGPDRARRAAEAALADLTRRLREGADEAPAAAAARRTA